LARYSELVIFGDFLEPADAIAKSLGGIARQGVRGHMLQILDPAEESLPYNGRIEFLDEENGARYVAERAESLREGYQHRLAAHKAAVTSLARGLSWAPFLHHTDRPAVEALLPLHMHLAGLEKAYRAKGVLKAGSGLRGNHS
jgi:uncharacterized protein (DUF58 family)